MSAMLTVHDQHKGTDVSRQWFVRIKPLAKTAVAAVVKGKTKILPSMWEGTYFDWMNNIRDWCISRQIWWGHRIPVWYCDSCGKMIVSTKDPDACPECGNSPLRQEEDVLDTWFLRLGLFQPRLRTDEAPKTFYPRSSRTDSNLFFWVARCDEMGLMR